jgi:hydroxyacylglutathione hydrolase
MKTWITKSGYSLKQILSGRSNVFLFSDGTRNILVDTSPKYKWIKLDKRLKQLSITQLDYLILTHAHFDHASNAYTLKEKYKPLVIIQKDEASYLENGQNTFVQGTNTFLNFFTKRFATKILASLTYASCNCDIIFDSIFDLKEFGFNAYILHTPGHSIGSSSIIIDDEIAIVGDTLFGVFPWSVFPPYADNVQQMIHSWGKLLATKCSKFLPSHGKFITRKQLQHGFDRKKFLFRNNQKLVETEFISFCGDNCSACPRFQATNENDRERLKYLAELWYRLGIRDHIVTPDEMMCRGCSHEKQCTHGINNCPEINKIGNCGECGLYPCNKIDKVFEKTESFRKICMEKCSASEFIVLDKAFLSKKKTLDKIHHAFME